MWVVEQTPLLLQQGAWFQTDRLGNRKRKTWDKLLFYTQHCWALLNSTNSPGYSPHHSSTQSSSCNFLYRGWNQGMLGIAWTVNLAEQYVNGDQVLLNQADY